MVRGTNILMRAAGRRLYTTRPPSSSSSSVSLANLETRWTTMSPAERSAVTKHLEEIQMGDWKALSAEQKKATYFVAFGAHGARTPVTQEGHGLRVIAGVGLVLAVSSGLMYATRVGGAEHPHTMSEEWRQKTTEYLKSQNSNPITGISSEGYKGKGY
ncbi:hypothetical protein O0I10_006184 [Lichtheimia ornata]|uniref:Cytochrome c oxidase subunit IV n=1 Tax=Lichtheimia ornata TaxID=688661 RepID=A0AAD7Y166_9FUNG|nr:uncharacterized protein O0I10_006184 [Lichtheimia ornata]KAJ8658177.1 hypothetical protein O0I10_006184 [Lichtheimia ornata]